MDRHALTQLVKTEALAMGFGAVGVAKAEHMADEARRLEAWLNDQNHGSMSYMERYFDMRTDPTVLVPGSKSVVTLLYNYFPEVAQPLNGAPRLARYAYGEDYHKVMRKKLKQLLRTLKERVGDINGRCFVDSGPVLERDWARRSGLGWVGKNTLLINPKKGSYYFLAEIISDLDLLPDAPIKDHCGTCTRCINACPTNAIAPEGYSLDASKCTSYLTIELRDAIPSEFAGNLENWVFGCDICQEVCPWNRFSAPNAEPAFEPFEELMDWGVNEWHEISTDVFEKVFEKSAVKRTGYKGLRRNLDFLAGDSESAT